MSNLPTVAWIWCYRLMREADFGRIRSFSMSGAVAVAVLLLSVMVYVIAIKPDDAGWGSIAVGLFFALMIAGGLSAVTIGCGHRSDALARGRAVRGLWFHMKSASDEDHANRLAKAKSAVTVLGSSSPVAGSSVQTSQPPPQSSTAIVAAARKFASGIEVMLVG